MADRLFTIDPDKVASGLAQFDRVPQQGPTSRGAWVWKLSAVAATNIWQWGSPGCGAVEIVVECPVPGRVPGIDLIESFGAGQRLAGQIEALARNAGAQVTTSVRYARSANGKRGWKGNLPKPAHHLAVLRELRTDELALLVQHTPDVIKYVNAAADRFAATRKITGYGRPIVEVLDAVALGLDVTGRLKV